MLYTHFNSEGAWRLNIVENVYSQEADYRIMSTRLMNC